MQLVSLLLFRDTTVERKVNFNSPLSLVILSTCTITVRVLCLLVEVAISSFKAETACMIIMMMIVGIDKKIPGAVSKCECPKTFLGGVGACGGPFYLVTNFRLLVVLT